jgi:hypothetical protein
VSCALSACVLMGGGFVFCRYATLCAADRKTLVALGIERVDEFARAYHDTVSAVTYLHTRRQRILEWLADTDAFSLLAWSSARDEFDQRILVSHDA